MGKTCILVLILLGLPEFPEASGMSEYPSLCRAVPFSSVAAVLAAPLELESQENFATRHLLLNALLNYQLLSHGADFACFVSSDQNLVFFYVR